MGDIARAEREFAALVREGDAPQTVTMNILIKAYARGGQPQRGMQILLSMLHGAPDAYGTQPSESTFNVVAAGFADSGDLESAVQVIETQRSCGFSAQNSFCSLVRCLPPERVLPTLQSGIAMGALLLDQKALHVALVALLETPRVPDFERASHVQYLAQQLGTPLSCKACTLVLLAYKRAGRERDGVIFFENYLGQPGARPDVKLFTMGLSLMVTLDPPLVGRAEALVNRMEEDFLVVPDVMVFNNLIKGYGNAKPPNVEKALAVFHRILSTDGIKPTEYSFSAVANVLSSAGRAEEAEEFVMGTMPKYNLQPAAIHYNILLKGYSKCRCRVTTGQCSCKICMCSNPDRAVELLGLMESRGLQCDVVTLQNVVEAFCSAAQLDKARSIVQDVMSNPSNPSSLRPTINVYNMLMRGVCVKYYVPQSDLSAGGKHVDKFCGAGRRVTFDDVAQSNVDAALADVDTILDDIKQNGLIPDEVTLNSILSIYCAFQLISKAEAIVAQQRTRPNVSKANLLMSFNILFYAYSNYRLPVGGENDGSLESDTAAQRDREAAALLSRIRGYLDDLNEAGVEPDTIALNTLVKIFADRGKPEEAEAMLEEVVCRARATREEAMAKIEARGIIDSKDMGAKLEHPLRAVANRTTFTTIINAYARANRRQDAQRVARLAETKYAISLPPSARSFSKESSADE
ncbi:Pentatricopeptide repeat-containing protein At2g17140 [Hondaea fermentalgiana]|uniref:Pentatricopeptide repeat-containing protein At2g17140 n=1 Tax=Hondaea fermentalgiana TaxID=2315210 RepID=A0A2R5GTA1_9STRA|nr:Pentatricopeptide repeat-containing protein At2g17140 [Hondaea fermentalgiana]|eukprot:GBG34097.1 Pentatricopeptide repeat-containing protein At2g17140 [Hondaea fermentalgiana]